MCWGENMLTRLGYGSLQCQGELLATNLDVRRLKGAAPEPEDVGEAALARGLIDPR